VTYSGAQGGALQVSLEVACTPEHAFSTWTGRIGSWWPRDHTVTGDARARVALEPWAGGRIVETGPDGVEHVWGVITVWDPPQRLRYRWHLGREPAEATDVDIRFTGSGQVTTVRIEHTGWSDRSESPDPWRDRNRAGWATLLPHFVRAAAEPG
jgi:hypothetical protein